MKKSPSPGNAQKAASNHCNCAMSQCHNANSSEAIARKRHRARKRVLLSDKRALLTTIRKWGCKVMKVYGKCVHCEKPMTKLEAEQSIMGNEDWDELTCDECSDAPEVGDKLVARQKGQQTWAHIGSTATVTHIGKGFVDLEFDDGHNIPWTKPVNVPDSRGVYWEKVR